MTSIVFTPEWSSLAETETICLSKRMTPCGEVVVIDGGVTSSSTVNCHLAAALLPRLSVTIVSTVYVPFSKETIGVKVAAVLSERVLAMPSTARPLPPLTTMSIVCHPERSSLAETETIGLSERIIPCGEVAVIDGGVTSSSTVNCHSTSVRLPCTSSTVTLAV